MNARITYIELRLALWEAHNALVMHDRLAARGFRVNPDERKRLTLARVTAMTRMQAAASNAGVSNDELAADLQKAGYALTVQRLQS